MLNILKTSSMLPLIKSAWSKESFHQRTISDEQAVTNQTYNNKETVLKDIDISQAYVTPIDGDTARPLAEWAQSIRRSVIYSNSIADLNNISTNDLQEGQQASVHNTPFIWRDNLWLQDGALNIDVFKYANDGDDWTRAFQDAAQTQSPIRLYDKRGYILSDTIIMEDGSRFFSDSEKMDTFNGDMKTPHLTQKGVWIVASNNFPVNKSVFLFKNNCSLKGVNLYYLKQDFNEWKLSDKVKVDLKGKTSELYDPIPYAPTIAQYDKSIRYRGLVVENSTFINSYCAIEFEKHERHRLENLNITPISNAIRIGDSSDVSIMDNILVFPFWSQPFGYAGNSARVNHRAEFDSVGFEIGSSDGQKIGKLSSIGAGTGLLFTDFGGRGGTQNCTIESFEQDLGPRGVDIKHGTDITINTLVATPIDTRSTSTDPNNAAYYYNSENLPETAGTIFGLKSESGGVININTLIVRRCQGYGVWITQGAYGTSIKKGSVFHQSPGGNGLRIENSDNYLYHVNVGEFIVNCISKEVMPYYIHDTNQCSFGSLQTSGVSPFKIGSFENNVKTSLDINSGRHKKYYKTIGTENKISVAPELLPCKIAISNSGLVILSSYGGVNIDGEVISFDSKVVTVKINGLTPEILYSVPYVTNSSVSKLQLAASNIDDICYLRVFDENGRSIEFSHPLVKGKEFTCMAMFV
ncbi:hypothetical protein GCM10027040_22170 [Halomonas shantousis]